MTDYQTAERMALKQQAIPLPDLKGKTVLDVGCDHGHWCWLAANGGASDVLGLDRNRKVKGEFVDVVQRNRAVARSMGLQCRFQEINLGKQWHEFGKFDVVFCFSMYHYIYEACKDHKVCWYWLWRHTNEVLLWENPTGENDGVVLRLGLDSYLRDDILEAAEIYFDVEIIGPALHVKTREVWRCTPKEFVEIDRHGKIETGQGGATKAFEYANGRRIDEIESILGVRVLPGSLNVWLDHPFDWDRHYYRAKILDVSERKKGLDVPWVLRWARFYPVTTWGAGAAAFVFRFDGEKYDDCFVELISKFKLMDLCADGRINVISQ